MKKNEDAEENGGYLGLFIVGIVFIIFMYYMAQLFKPQKISELDLEVLEEYKKEKLMMNEKIEE